MASEDDQQLRPDGFRDPSNALRVPKRCLISGEQIAKEVVRELSVPMPASTEDELSLSSSQRAIHPALQRLYARIPQAMTAFDDSRGEPLSWTQKYAPMHSADVLQPNTEITVLKDWLKSLSVQAVGGAATQSKTEQPKRVDKAPKKKRKKKPDDLDDFLVDSDDDLREMTELPDNDDAFNIAGTRRTQASIVQMVQQNAKLSNAVLLSGPHGCGKSAAAYAVAKELGFKVFEISSSERRSGRDVLDKVGDLTENHNVRHHGAAPEELQTPLEPNLHDEAFQRDLESGRQGKMNAFFRPQVAKKKAAPTHGT
jgi:SpoVK/Ycf46/Vps4 family AAA+-type ATPase